MSKKNGIVSVLPYQLIIDHLNHEDSDQTYDLIEVIAIPMRRKFFSGHCLSQKSIESNPLISQRVSGDSLEESLYKE